MPKKNMHKGAKPSTFKNAFYLRNNMTRAEKLLWEYLKSKKLGGYKFRNQHTISNYVLDFYCHEVSLAIELDGEIHNTCEAQIYDEERTKFLNNIGVNVIRFSNDEIYADIELVKEKILDKIRKIEGSKNEL